MKGMKKNLLLGNPCEMRAKAKHLNPSDGGHEEELG
jgi:hypothetical protein